MCVCVGGGGDKYRGGTISKRAGVYFQWGGIDLRGGGGYKGDSYRGGMLTKGVGVHKLDFS